MTLTIADTFTDSLARLTDAEQKAVKLTVFDLQVNPAAPGMQFHRVERARDKNFWSVRVSSDVRLIVHRTDGNLLLAFVGHHDDAYQWAERRRLETHPRTGAAQWVEIRERVEEVVIQRPVEPPVLGHVSADDLLDCGVPLEWVEVVRRATEDEILNVATRLPAEAAEAVLQLATGTIPRRMQPEYEREVTATSWAVADRVAETGSYATSLPPVDAPDREAFEHPDAQRRFRVVANVEELARALEYPWDRWTIFLHPAQREAVERSYNGPARVSGSAGTGKTIVALHRAVFLARAHADARVLLATFSEPLAHALRVRLRRLIGNEPRIAERLEVEAVDAIARRLYERNFGRVEVASAEVVARELDGGSRFVRSEWEDVVDAWQLTSWEAYRDVARLGRKTRLPEKQRQALWDVFERVRASLRAKGLVTMAQVLSRLATELPKSNHAPFDFVVVDEAQDVSVAQLRFLAALGARRPDALFFAGDLGQRIFQQPFSWKALGVDIRGRSRTLRVNYRTSHQIRGTADRLLGPEVSDVDGNTEERRKTVSVFNGPAPTIRVLRDADEERGVVGAWLAQRMAEGVKPNEAAVFVRSAGQMARARAAVVEAGLTPRELDDRVETATGSVAIGTMHLAKGLEFRAVAVMACDDEVLPQKERLEAVADDSDLQEVYDTERHLLYVACTRARDCLLVTGTEPASEFLDDLRG